MNEARFSSQTAVRSEYAEVWHSGINSFFVLSNPFNSSPGRQFWIRQCTGSQFIFGHAVILHGCEISPPLHLSSHASYLLDVTVI